VTPNTASVDIGGTTTLVANVSVANGAPTTVTWSSSSPAIATVTAAGVVQGVTAGTATITATSTFNAARTGQATVTVNPPPAVLAVAVTGAPAALIAGTTAQLAANVTVVGGASTAVTWATSNPGIATVTPAGLVTAVAAGNVTITATSSADATKQGTAAIRVDAGPIVNSVTVTPPTVGINVGANSLLTATVAVGNNASQAVTWSSSNTAIATVTQTGNVTGVAAGVANIRATSQADATKFGESVVTVTLQTFPSVGQVAAGVDATFDPSTLDLARGGTVTWVFASLTHNVTFADVNGAPQDIGNQTSTSVSRTFSTAGTFNYVCTLHSGMNGRVVVH
jgi:uncharacterized protein YjdB